MTTFDDDARTFVQAHLDEHGFLSWLDLTVESIEPGYLVMRVPYDEKLANHGTGAEGQVHGGIASTLVDTAGGVACQSALDDPVAGGAATIDLNVSYLRPAVGDLVAEADVVRVGSTVGVATVTVESDTPDDGVQPVAEGRGSYRLFRSE
jgi:uncharacterized protein (TIGR00369 family)